MFIEVTTGMGDFKYKYLLNTRYVRCVYPAVFKDDGATTIEIQDQTPMTVLEGYEELRMRLGIASAFSPTGTNPK